MPRFVVWNQEQATDESVTAIFCDLGAGPHPIIVSAPIFQITEELVHQSEGEITIKLQLRIAGEELIVVGSRAKPRSVTESTVPVDVIRTEDFTSQGSSDLANQLRTVVPSFSVSIQPISDAATIVRPANLRNLAPDHTLILVNGKRRHRAAVITWLGNGVADGSQGPDLSVIPSIAIRQAEVLRDGAAAQYGSDAIAGVMNFQLKDSRSGGSLEFRTGVYRNANPGSPSTCGAGIIGDIQHSCNGIGGHGQAFMFAGNVGLPLGSAGFVNLSLEYGSANPTNRSIQREDAQAIIAAGNTNLRKPAQIWGSPKLDDDLKLFVNFGYPFENGLQFYPSCDGNCEGISGSSRKHSLRRPPAPARSVPTTLPSRYGGPLPPPLNHPIYRLTTTLFDIAVSLNILLYSELRGVLGFGCTPSQHLSFIVSMVMIVLVDRDRLPRLLGFSPRRLVFQERSAPQLFYANLVDRIFHSAADLSHIHAIFEKLQQL